MDDREDVCVLIPTYNEAATIGDIVEGFVDQGYTNVLVVDGHSTDDTRAIAGSAGARVVEQSGRGKGSGKGQAVREGIELVDAPYVLMLDGDGTYRPKDADAMLEPLVAGEADHVIGNRFADLREGAMPRLNQLGNPLINFAFRTIHHRNFVDILSGYRAFTRESVERMNLTADGFAIETELSVECVKHNVPVEVVPITYAPRPDGSEPNLNPIGDGGRIIFALYRLTKTNNPLFYFGSLAGLNMIVGVGIAAWVAYEWFVLNTSHNVIATVAGVTFLLGVQLLIFGVLADIIMTLHREQLRQLRQIEKQTSDRQWTDRAGERAAGASAGAGHGEGSPSNASPADSDSRGADAGGPDESEETDAVAADPSPDGAAGADHPGGP